MARVWKSSFAVTMLSTLAALTPSTWAHSNMVNPKPKWPEGFYNGNSPYGTINGKQFASEIPDHEGVKKITAALGSSSLRDFVMTNLKLDPGMQGATKECGMSLMDGPAQELPDTIDFPWGHPGPCEAWCDNTKIGGAADCQGTGYKLTGAKAKCAGAKRLQAMYVGVHVIDWQVYTNCAPIGGGGGGSNSSPSPSSAPSPSSSNGPGPNPSGTPAPAPGPTSTPNPGPSSNAPSSSRPPRPSNGPMTRNPSAPSSRPRSETPPGLRGGADGHSFDFFGW